MSKSMIISKCLECGDICGLNYRCLEHRGSSLLSSVNQRPCNICNEAFYVIDKSKGKSNFLCQRCRYSLCAWVFNQFDIDHEVTDRDNKCYYPFNFYGFVTLNGPDIYYSKIDLSSMNIDPKLFNGKLDVDKVLDILSINGIDVSDKIQIIIRKTKSAASNISLIKK